MHTLRAQHFRHRLIWLVGLAVLWSAWLPVWAPVLRGAWGQASADWVEVCSATGSRWVAVDGTAPVASRGMQPGDDGSGMNGGMSCPFCLLQHHHHAWAPPPVVALHLQPLSRPPVTRVTFHAPGPQWDRWPGAHPRAPPAQA